MASAEQYATWIVQNEGLKGTPEFETVAQAYRLARENSPATIAPEKETPVTASGLGAEIGKGLARGPMELGRTFRDIAMGPAGSLIGRALDPIERPVRDFFKASPANPTEQFAGTASEILGSAIPAGGVGSLKAALLSGASALGGATGEQIGGEKGRLIGTLLPTAATMARPIAQAASRSLMQSAIKPTIKDLKTGDAARAIDTMLEEGINPNMGGVQKLKENIFVLNNQIRDAIQNSTATIDKQAAGRHLQDTLNKFANQVDSAADLDAIRSTWSRFLQNPLIKGEQIPVQTAQDLKQGTYKILAKKYGQVGSADTEAQKAIARGLKDEIANAVPEVGPLNSRESDLLNALKVSERRALMEINKNPMGLSLLASNPATWAAFLADRSAAFKAIVARMLYSSQQAIPDAATAARIGAAQTAQPLGGLLGGTYSQQNR